jgi:hypothetical protein
VTFSIANISSAFFLSETTTYFHVSCIMIYHSCDQNVNPFNHEKKKMSIKYMIKNEEKYTRKNEKNASQHFIQKKKASFFVHNRLISDSNPSPGYSLLHKLFARLPNSAQTQ